MLLSFPNKIEIIDEISLNCLHCWYSKFMFGTARRGQPELALNSKHAPQPHSFVKFVKGKVESTRYTDFVVKHQVFTRKHNLFQSVWQRVDPWSWSVPVVSLVVLLTVMYTDCTVYHVYHTCVCTVPTQYIIKQDRQSTLYLMLQALFIVGLWRLPFFLYCCYFTMA